MPKQGRVDLTLEVDTKKLRVCLWGFLPGRVSMMFLRPVQAEQTASRMVLPGKSELREV